MVNYNIKWNSHSNSSEESMPLGGFDTGCNIWVEKNNLYLYLSQSGTFDENGTMLKLARIRIWAEDDSILFSKNFIQELHVKNGYILIDAGEEGNKVNFKIWAAVNKSEIHIEYQSQQPHTLRVALENWRYCNREVSSQELSQCRDFDMGYQGSVTTYADVVEPMEDRLIFYHQNNNEKLVWDILIKQQHLTEINEHIPNPLLNRIMGGIITMKGMQYYGTYHDTYAGTDFCGYMYEGKEVTKKDIIVTVHTNCCDSVTIWKEELFKRVGIKTSFDQSCKWWKNYFDKSYIHIDQDNKGSANYIIARNYQLFRYMLGCNYYGEYPTKFNGGLFTFDAGRTPDFRQWSGIGFTSQNQRLVYWGMLKSGDFEGMRTQLDYFKNLTQAAKARVKYFFNHDGAFFYEQGNIFGICTGAEYGWSHCSEISYGLEDNPWVRLHFSTGLEFALMMLEYSRYSGELIDEYMDYIENIIVFYMEHYTINDSGKLYIFPSSALETYKGIDPYSKDDNKYGCANPADAVAGLRCVLEMLIDYLDNDDKIVKYKNYLSQCCELPIGVNKEGKCVYLPASEYDPKPFNCELPELYRVYPYSPYGLTGEEIEIGRNTYEQPYASKDMYLSYSWHQNGIFAARLGLLDEAQKYLNEKLGNAPIRFPAFWGPGHDWTPDHNHGGSGMIELQEMLMQCDKDKIRLFPCWDKNLDVAFKLHAPKNTIVECELKKGEIIKLNIIPEYRKSDIEIFCNIEFE